MPGLLIRSESIGPQSEAVSSWDRQLARWENEGGRVRDVPEVVAHRTGDTGRPGSVGCTAEDQSCG